MNDLDTIPWYRSAILRGILIAVCTQAIAQAQQHFHIDFALFGVNANDAASWLMDIISAAAVAYAVHGRVAKPVPPVTLTKAAADAANAPAPPINFTQPVTPAPKETQK